MGCSSTSQNQIQATPSKWAKQDMCSISGCLSAQGEEFLSGLAYHFYAEDKSYDEINKDFERCDKEIINAKNLCNTFWSRQKPSRGDIKEMFKEAKVAQKAADFRSEVYQELSSLINK